MTLWLVRAGKYGEFEAKFLDENRVYLTWEGGLQQMDLTHAADYEAVKARVTSAYPADPPKRVGNWSGQIWAFTVAMKVGDWVVVPMKGSPVIAFGEIAGPYQYSSSAAEPFRHSRAVNWLRKDVPRAAIDQDLLYSFGAFMTVCQISRNDAEKRIKALAAAGWKSAGPKKGPDHPVVDAGAEAPTDLAQLARDQIAALIIARYKGHGLERLVEAVLKAQGYTTFHSKEGADKGIDILAAPGPLGFGKPRLCVQVKSGDDPVDTPTLNQLIGSMSNVKADQGLLVSWGGFKPTVLKEEPAQFFNVRLWNQRVLIDEVLDHYDALAPDIRAELPLKRIWTVAGEDQDSKPT